MKHQTGTPRFCEWDGLWAHKLTDSRVAPAEYERVACEFDGYCRGRYKASPTFGEDFYIRGDYTGDRTQVLEVNNPRILTADFLRCIQDWLKLPEHEEWRVLIPTYLTKDEVIIVYPCAIRISERYETSLEKGLKIISARMKSYVE